MNREVNTIPISRDKEVPCDCVGCTMTITVEQDGRRRCTAHKAKRRVW